MTALLVQPPLFRSKRAGERQPSVFLAGSIEMGVAANWQLMLTERIKGDYSMIYNPRRDNWDSTWEQKIDHPDFNVQVNWELDMIERADIIAFYFDPNTKSPITLAELGIVSVLKPYFVHVCCPDGYFRKGNVDIICERAGIKTYDSLRELADGLIAASADFQALPDADDES